MIILTHALQNNSRVKTNYLWVKANCLRVLVDTCREIFDYSRARLKLELSGTIQDSIRARKGEHKCRCVESLATARVIEKCTITRRNYIFIGYPPRVTSECSPNSSTDQQRHDVVKSTTMILHGWTHASIEELQPYQ